MNIDIRKTMGYSQGYSEGFKEGYSKALEMFHKELENAIASRPIKIVIPNKKWQ